MKMNYGQKPDSVRMGNPCPYTSMYGYAKRKHEVLNNADDQVIGYIKEEEVLDGDGEVAYSTYYTRSFDRPGGAKRFFDSPQALLKAFGYAVKRKPVTKMAATKKARPVKKPARKKTA